MDISKGVKYGTEVWINNATDDLKKTECLCLNCENIKLCDTAKQLYNMCVIDDIAIMITRCKDFKLKI